MQILRQPPRHLQRRPLRFGRLRRLLGLRLLQLRRWFAGRRGRRRGLPSRQALQHCELRRIGLGSLFRLQLYRHLSRTGELAQGVVPGRLHGRLRRAQRRGAPGHDIERFDERPQRRRGVGLELKRFHFQAAL